MAEIIKNTVAVLGGDRRYMYVCENLAKMGYKVYRLCGVDKDELSENIESGAMDIVLPTVEYVILPMPVSKDNVNIFAPSFPENVSIDSCFRCINPESVVIGGCVTSVIGLKAAVNEIAIYDILENEELAIKNVIPTVEGAVELAINSTDKTLFGSKCLVIGYGRISKILARVLKAMGARVTVTSRRGDHKAWIIADGYDYCYTLDIKKVIDDVDVVFNTAPDMVLTKGVLKNMKEKALIIDLASGDGGTDFNSADELNIKAIHARALPGKTAPISSAQYISEVASAYFENHRGGGYL